MNRFHWIAAAVFLGPCVSHAAEPAPTSAGVEFFETRIRPVLVEQCYSCHSEASKKAKGGVLLDSREAIRKGGDLGPILDGKKPQDSRLLKTLRYDGDIQMPPKGKLSDKQIADFTRWVEMGAPDPRDSAATAATGTIDWGTARQFWSFQPVRRPPLPPVQNPAWVQSPVDAFILHALESQKLTPVPAADRRTLIRRVTFDLTGLPPTPESVEAFVRDASPQAFARVVDRLLDSPAYGEHQARFWLDVARYAEDQAHTFAVTPNTNAYRYRDWVIDAFNRDLPARDFVRYQVAADLISPEDPAMIPHRAALGFFGLGAQYYKNTDAAKATAEELDDRVDTLTRGFLGLTVSCARCHDHKFDPIPTLDYYSIAGIFSSSRLANLPLAPRPEVERYEAAKRQATEAENGVKEFLKTQKEQLHKARAAEVARYFTAAWRLESQKLEKGTPSPAEVAREQKVDAPTLERFARFLTRKQNTNPLGELFTRVAPRKGPAAPADLEAVALQAQTTVQTALAAPPKGGNAGAAKMNADLVKALFLENPVFVITDAEVLTHLDGAATTRLQELKGRQLQAQAALPPAPPIVHGLAEGNAADLKVALRGNPLKPGEVAPRRFLQALCSDEPVRFTRGSGRLELAEAIADPKNPLTYRVLVNRIWQQHFGRGIVGTPSNFGTLGERPTHPELLDYLTDEFIRGGGSIKQLHRLIVLSSTYQLGSQNHAENAQVDADNRYLWRMNRTRLRVEAFRDSLLQVAGRLDSTHGGPTTNLDSDGNARRTVYGKVSRHELNGLLRLFDFPDANITAERRSETTVPQQQLFVLNSPFCVQQARAFAARLQGEAASDAGRIERAYRLAYGRPPRERELQIGLQYLAGTDPAPEQGKNGLSRWERYTQALLAANEFIYVD